MTKQHKQLQYQNGPTGGKDTNDRNDVLEQGLLLDAESLEIELAPDAAYQLEQALQRASNEDWYRRIDRWIATICSTEPSVVTRSAKKVRLVCR
jgi:hypothetical protein